MDPTPKDAPTFTQVYQSFIQTLGQEFRRGMFRDSGELAVRAAKPFDPNQSRRLRPELLILLAYVALMGVTFAIFNL